MYSYLMRRLAFGALTVVGVSIVVFMVLRVLPGDPLVALFGPEGFTKLSAAERARYMADLGLSDPLVVQYLHWIADIARGDLGHSFFRAESVAEMLSRRGPLTAEIGLIAVVLSWIVGIPVAIVSALRPNSLGDNVSRFISILFLAVPGFVLAGSIPVERAFATPGLGYAMYTAVSERDVFVMQNLVLLYAVVFVVLNIGIDVIIAWLDPRIRYR